MKLNVAFINERISDQTNYKGQQLLVHTMIIYDAELEADSHYGPTVYSLDSTFLPEWKQRDIEVRLYDAKLIIESLKRDPNQIGTGSISIELDPSQLPVYPIDSYEDDCRLYDLEGYKK